MPKKASIQRDTNRKRKKEEDRETLKEIKRRTKVAAKSKAARDRKKLAAKPVPCHMAMGDDAPEHAHWVQNSTVCVPFEVGGIDLTPTCSCIDTCNVHTSTRTSIRTSLQYVHTYVHPPGTPSIRPPNLREKNGAPETRASLN